MVQIEAGQIFNISEIFKQIGTMPGAMALSAKPNEAYRPIPSDVRATLPETYVVRYAGKDGTIIAQPFVDRFYKDEKTLKFSGKLLTTFTPMGADNTIRNLGNSLASKVSAAKAEIPRDLHILAAALQAAGEEVAQSMPRPSFARTTGSLIAQAGAQGSDVIIG